MLKLKIDQRDVEVPPGATILDAARKLGIDVPTLCFLEGYRPSTSCLACMVKIRGHERLVPACATAAADGMEVESETAEVHEVRKTALELLLSDHLGDCLAPCWFGCPAHMDIPLMLRQIAAEELHEAIVTIKNDIALPAVLGRVCPKPCEKVCRRDAADGAVAICELKRYVADVDLASGDPYLPECEPSAGCRVAIVGGGPTGLSAAYYLRRKGHAVTIFDERPQLGGRLRQETTEEELPGDVLDAEIAQITRLGIEVRLELGVGSSESADGSGQPRPSLGSLLRKFDAVLVACGASAKEQAAAWGLKVSSRGIEVDHHTYLVKDRDRESPPAPLFAAGNAVRGKAMIVRSVADGKEAAVAVDQSLRGLAVTGPEKPFNSRIGKVTAEEMPQFLAAAAAEPRVELSSHAGLVRAGGDEGSGFGVQGSELSTSDSQSPTPDLQSPIPNPQSLFAEDPNVAGPQAARCLHCDCRALADCKLRRYAAKYGADPHRYQGRRAAFEQDLRHAEVMYEPGKCIHCGLCIEIASQAGEKLGLTFIGRGFDVRVGVPFDRSLAEALAKVAARCVAACPTAALAMKDLPQQVESPRPLPQAGEGGREAAG